MRLADYIKPILEESMSALCPQLTQSRILDAIQDVDMNQGAAGEILKAFFSAFTMIENLDPNIPSFRSMQESLWESIAEHCEEVCNIPSDDNES